MTGFRWKCTQVCDLLVEIKGKIIAEEFDPFPDEIEVLHRLLAAVANFAQGSDAALARAVSVWVERESKGG